MKKIVINSDNRRFNISSIVVGYLEENKEEVLEFEIPEKYAEYGKKACFSANGQTFAKNFDDVISNKLTITRDISQFKELDMTIEFFKIENEDEIVARTSILHILIENAIICDDDIKPDEPKIIILDNLIDEVTKLDVLVTKNEEKREEYYQEIQKKVDNGDLNGATFTPSVDTEGNINWTNDKNLPNPTTQNIKGPKGDTYNLTEQDKKDISSMTVESSESMFNQYYNDKLQSFNENSTSKTIEFNNNATNKTNEFNTNADAKLQEYNTNADNKIAEYDLHSEELDNKIIDTRNELERVKNDVLETGTDTDTFIHLEDSAMAEYQELSIDGVCKQETTTGKNKLNISSSYSLTGTQTIYMDEIPGGTYILSCSSNDSPSDNSSRFQFQDNDGNEVGLVYLDSSHLSRNINLSANATKLNIYSRGTYNASQNATLNVENLMLSTNGGDYEPYTGGQPSPSPDYPQPISTIENSLKITSCNKNLWNVDNIEIGSINENGVFVSSNVRARAYYQKIQNNDRITISSGISGLSVVPYFYDKNKKFISYNNGWKTMPYTFDIVKDAKYVAFLFKNSSNTINLDELTQIQLEQNSTATPFEEHLETQITANLPEGEFIGKISDTYKDTLKVEYNEEDGQHHLKLYKNIGKKVFDGSENWNKSTSYPGNYYCQSTVPYAITFDVNCFSNLTNIFFNSYTQLSNGDNGIMLEGGGTNKTIDFKISSISTLVDFKSFLGNTNLILYYVLATPYIVDLGICDMPITYNETTNLFTDSDLLPTINVKYYRNFISTVRNLQVNEKALKQELIDINTRLSALESVQTSTTSESEVVE